MNIVIAGGGTAGWLTALYVKKKYKEYNIILIQDKKIGILGAGEASTPHLIKFLHKIDLSIFEIIKNTKATIKNTSKFTNWSKNNNYFFHPFEYNNLKISERHGYFDNDFKTNFFHLTALLKNENMKEYCMINKISKNNLTPFLNNDLALDFNQVMEWSLNFDASLLAQYLEKIGEKRNIKIHIAG